MTEKYDTREALRLLAEAADKLGPDVQGRRQAATELLDALVKLSGQQGFQFARHRQNEDMVFMQRPGADPSRSQSTTVRYHDDEGKFSYTRGNAVDRPLSLTYSRVTGAFVGPIEAGEDGVKRPQPALVTVLKALLGVSALDWVNNP